MCEGATYACRSIQEKVSGQNHWYVPSSLVIKATLQMVQGGRLIAKHLIILLRSVAGRQVAKERDIASAVAASLCIVGTANVIRVHDAAAGWDAARVSDAILHC